MAQIHGSFWVFILYDVAEEINLAEARRILGARPPHPEPRFKDPSPEYVRFEKPPVTDPIRISLSASGDELSGQIKFFDYGVVSLALQVEQVAEWRDLVRSSVRWINSAELERAAKEAARRYVDTLSPALKAAYSDWLTEDYYVLHVRDLHDGDGRPAAASGILRDFGPAIAQIVRGEARPLSSGEEHEVLQSNISYYPDDLLVVGWTAALICDTPEGAAPTIQLLEYANTQLLEFRHYDAVLSRVLSEVYRALEPRRGIMGRWRLARQANRLNAIRLDVIELTERVDNAIKFLSDMYSARAYKLAAEKIGVTDYRNLVDEKLRTAGELYEFLVNEFHQARAFVLEFMVVAILVIELVMLFRGKGF